MRCDPALPYIRSTDRRNLAVAGYRKRHNERIAGKQLIRVTGVSLSDLSSEVAGNMRYSSWHHRWLPAAAVLFLAPVLASFAAAADLKPRQIIAEFEVAPDGDFLRVPVTIRQKAYPFLVNTGLVTSAIDQELQKALELPKIRVEVRGKRGARVREHFGGLEATLGNIPLEFPAGVETADYAALSGKLDLECQGEIGMDVLQRYIVQIDFDQGILRFLTSLPPSPGEMFRITPLGGEGGAPTIPATIPGFPPEKFVVSTGRAGSALEIRSELLGDLVEKQQVKILDKDKGITRSGSRNYQFGRLDAVQIGKFRHESLIVNASEQNAIGLSYLARYVVTFDFPRNRLYLKKGKTFDAPDDHFTLWDVAVDRDGEKVVIREVGGYGPAHRLGLQTGDVVESINECPAKRLSNWQVRRLFGREGRPVKTVVLRGTERLTLETSATAAAATASDEEK